MSSTIEQIDNYLRKNKKTLYANLNKWYGEKKSNGSFVLDDDAKNLKRMWEDAQNAKGINDKIASFNKLKEELAHWTNPEELAKQESELEGYGLDNWPEFEDSQELDKLRFFDQLSVTPETNKLDDLNVDEIYSQGYDYEQMKALAEQYGYDYKDKSDRKEFLDKVYEYHKAKNVEDAFKTNDIGGVAVDFALPVSKEYAKRNYDKIHTDSKWNFTKDMGGPLATDAATNVAMMGFPGKFVQAPAAKMALNNVAAPAIREGAQMFINDKPLGDAGVDFVGAAATNYATPYALNRGFRWVNRVVQPESKLAAQDIVNKTANKVRDIERQLKEGKVFRRDNHDGSFTFARKDSKGNIINISNEEAAKAKDIIPMEDYEFYMNNRNIARSTSKKNRNQFVNEDIMMLGGKEKFNSNLQNSKPRFENMSTYEVADAANIKPKEGIINWLSNSEGANRASEYVNNFLGQTRYATPMLNAITQSTLGPIADYVKIEKKKRLSESELMELDMLQRMRELHKKNPNMFSAPKIPDKYKEFFDENKKTQWNSDTNIRSIFGEE